MLLPCWGWPNGRESKAKLENPIASGVVWMDQPERERDKPGAGEERKS